MNATPGAVQSVDRVLDIAEALATAPQGLLLSELAEMVHLHVSTAHRLVNALAERGYAVKDATSKKYRLTLRLFELGSRVCGALDLLTIAVPMLDDLAGFAQEAVHFVERDGCDVIYLYKSEPFQQLVRMSSCVGRRNPLYCTGVGKSILALLPDKEIGEIWAQSAIIPYTEHTLTSLDEMLRQVELIRRCGYAIDDEENEPGVRCVAAAIHDWSGHPAGAVSVSAPISRMDDAVVARIAPKLLEVTQRISRLLGEA